MRREKDLVIIYFYYISRHLFVGAGCGFGLKQF